MCSTWLHNLRHFSFFAASIAMTSTRFAFFAFDSFSMLARGPDLFFLRWKTRRKWFAVLRRVLISGDHPYTDFWWLPLGGRAMHLQEFWILFVRSLAHSSALQSVKSSYGVASLRIASSFLVSTLREFHYRGSLGIVAAWFVILNLMYWWSLSEIVSRTSHLAMLLANAGEAIVRSIIDDPFWLQNVGVLPEMQIISPSALMDSERASPLLLFELLPQSVWWAMKSPVTRIRELADLIIISSLVIKSKYSRWV